MKIWNLGPDAPCFICRCRWPYPSLYHINVKTNYDNEYVRIQEMLCFRCAVDTSTVSGMLKDILMVPEIYDWTYTSPMTGELWKINL